jgi:ABC-2 type transport system ATP-binding protein
VKATQKGRRPSSDEGDTLPLCLFFGGSGPNFRALAAGPSARCSESSPAPRRQTRATTYIVGAPELEFTYSGTGSSSHVYAQIVDDSTGLVLGN